MNKIKYFIQVIIFLMPVVGYSATFTVNSSTDETDTTPGDGVCYSSSGVCTLRAAVMEANATTGADSIILSKGTTYTLSIPGIGEAAGATGDLDITDDLTISTIGGKATISAASIDRIFDVVNADLSLKNMTLSNGSASDSNGGALNFNDSAGSGKLTIENVVFSNNACSATTAKMSCYGGAIYGDFNGTTVSIASSRFVSNAVSSSVYVSVATCGDVCGGAIFLNSENNSTVTINKAIFDGNSVSVSSDSTIANGGALYGDLTDSTFSITSSRFTSNSVSNLGNGSGISNGGGVELNIENSTVTINNTIFDGNSVSATNSGASTAEGGALHGEAIDSTISITSSRFTSNSVSNSSSGSTSSDGGGVDLSTENSTVTIDSSSFNNNTLTNTGGGSQSCQGGGIHFVSAGNGDDITISKTTFDSNTLSSSDPEGGGIHVNESGSFTDPLQFIINNTAFTNNVLNSSSIYNGDGGGLKLVVSVTTTPIQITNSTFSGNKTTSHGAGLNIDGPPVEIRNCTITNNASDAPGSGLYTDSASDVTLVNTILAGNTPYDSTSSVSLASADCYGPSTSDGYNIIGMIDTVKYTYCKITAATGDQFGSTTSPVDAMLGPLANNGGITKTHSLLGGKLGGSPAIDTGDSAGCTDADGNTLTTDQRGFPRPTDGNTDGTAVCDIGAFEKN